LIRLGLGGEEPNRSGISYVLTLLRENGDSIARGRGARLKKVLSARCDICFQYIRTTVVFQGSGYIAPVLPIILIAPKYLNGSLDQVMQAASAFTIVQAAFNWLVAIYPRLADWTASPRAVADGVT
jgi:putative ATP-binding cassette transporter